MFNQAILYVSRTTLECECVPPTILTGNSRGSGCPREGAIPAVYVGKDILHGQIDAPPRNGHLFHYESVQEAATTDHKLIKWASFHCKGCRHKPLRSGNPDGFLRVRLGTGLSDPWFPADRDFPKIVSKFQSRFRSNSATLTTPRLLFGPKRDFHTGTGILARTATGHIPPPKISRFLIVCRITVRSTCTHSWCRRASRQIHRQARGGSPRSGRCTNITS